MTILKCTNCGRLEEEHWCNNFIDGKYEKFTPIQTPQRSKLPAEKTAREQAISKEIPEFVLKNKILNIDRAYDADDEIIRKVISVKNVAEFVGRVRDKIANWEYQAIDGIKLILEIDKLAGDLK